MRLALRLGVLAASLAAWPALAAQVDTIAGTVSSGSGAGAIGVGSARVTIFQTDVGAPRTLGTTLTDELGRFRVQVRPDRRDGGTIYAVASKGAPVELVTLIGTEPGSPIVVNEMTTVSAAYTLARLLDNGFIPAKPALPVQVATGFAHDLVSIGTGAPSALMTQSPNADETNAWRLLGTLSNLLVPCVRGLDGCNQLLALATPPGGAAPTTTFQAMAAIARNPAANVQGLFDLAARTAVYAPALGAAQGPTAPDIRQRLDALTLAIKFNATGRTNRGTGQELCPFGGTANIAFDTDGTAWVTNNVVQGTPNSTNCIAVLKPDGTPSDGTGGTPVSPLFGGGVLGQAFGIGFDPKGTVWSGNFGWGNLDPTGRNGQPAGSVSRFTASGKPLSPPLGFTGKVFKAQGVVSDRFGNIFVAAFGNNVLQVFPGGDPSDASLVYQDENTLPFDVRIGPDNAAWVTYNGTGAVSKFAPVRGGARLRRLFTVSLGTPSATGHPEHISGGPKGVAIDSFGNAWVAHGEDDAVYAIDPTGKTMRKFVGGGMVGPWGLSLDADQTIWVSNFGPFGPTDIKFRISNLCGADITKCPAGLHTGDPISPATGYTLPSAGSQVLLHSGMPLYSPVAQPSYDPMMRSTSVNADMAGNIWCVNNWKPDWVNDITKNPGGDGVVVFIGLAAPVKPKLFSGPPTSPFRSAD